MTEKKKLNLPYVGINSFMKKPICNDLEELDAHVAVIGVPYDMSTQYRSGTKMGPEAIRRGSKLVAFDNEDGIYDHEADDVYLQSKWKIVDCGDVDMIHGDLNRSFENIEADIRKIVEKNAMPVVMGGDHSITIPVVRGLEELGPIGIIHIDAHLDWADDRGGQKLGHGSPLRRASEMDHVKGMAQFGVRGLGSSTRSDFEDARKFGSLILSPRQIRKMGVDKAIELIPQFDRYYVTIDIDGMDPSIAPGTGTPAAGGFYYYELKEILEGIVKKGNIIGFDMVEVAPQYDPTGYTEQFAARIMCEFIGLILKERE